MTAGKKNRRACRLTPGTRFHSRKAAEAAELERRINSGANGQHVVTNYEIKPCACNGVHLVAVTAP